MSKKLISILKYVLGLGLGVFLFYFAFRDRSIASLIDDFRSANLWWLLIAILVNILSHYIRGLRWRLQLRASGYSPSRLHTFAAVMVTYLVNLAIPRAGEVARGSVLLKSDKIPLTVSFGTVVTERIFDLIVLVLLIGIMFVLETETLWAYWTKMSAGSSDGGGIPVWVWIGLGVVVLGLAVLWVLRKKIMESALFQKARKLAIELIESALSIRNLESPVLFILYTILIWFCYWLMTYLAFFSIAEIAALETNLLYLGFVVLILGGIGMAIPIPGGMGPYHNAVIFAFVAFKAAPTEALCNSLGQTFAFAIHTSQMLISVPIVGALCYLYLVTVKPKDSQIKNG